MSNYLLFVGKRGKEYLFKLTFSVLPNNGYVTAIIHSFAHLFTKPRPIMM